MKVETAAQQIRKILKDNCFKRETLQTTGKIHFNRLPFYKSSRHLFVKPSDLKGKKYHVELLIDYSGSMWGEPMPSSYDEAVAGLPTYSTTASISPLSFSSFFGRPDRHTPAIKSGEAVAAIMGKYCDLNITLFNYLETTVSYKDFRGGAYWRKSYDELPDAILAEDSEGGRHLVPAWRKTYMSSLGSNYHQTAGNWEICQILNAAARLRKKDGRKVLMILLDGKPNLDDFGGENPTEKLYIAGRRVDLLPTKKYKKLIKGLESEGIEIVAFGIDTDNPQKYFTNFEYIDTSSANNAILPALIKQFKRIVK